MESQVKVLFDLEPNRQANEDVSAKQVNAKTKASDRLTRWPSTG